MIKITDPDDIKQYYDAGTNSYIFKIDNVLQDIEICFYNFYIDANIIAANIRADNIYAKNIQAHYIYCEDITCEDITAYGIYAGNIIAYDIKAGDTPEEDDLFYCIRACGNINAHNITAYSNIIAVDISANDIKAGDIRSYGNISANDINAEDIIACVISARDIHYYMVCIAYNKLRYRTATGLEIKSKHICLNE